MKKIIVKKLMGGVCRIYIDKVDGKEIVKRIVTDLDPGFNLKTVSATNFNIL